MSKDRLLKKGFTLIELLVVISIIGILATLLMANLTSMRGRARDAQRKSDIRNIQTALRLYYSDLNGWPDDSSTKIVGCGNNGATVCEWGFPFLVTGKDAYMSILPEDPSPDRKYVYNRDNDDPEKYYLSACIENESDSGCIVGSSCTEAYCVGEGCTAPEGCILMVSP